MTIPSEHQEAVDAVARETEERSRAMDASVDNTRSVTEVNRALVGYHQARATLRQTFAHVVPWGLALAIAWSVWAMVHWG